MKVLVACEFSGIVRRAFAKKGHKVYSCDLLPAEDNSPNHIQGDVLDILNGYNGFKWDLMIAHPPCTYLTNAGVRHLHDNVTSKNGVRAKIYGQARMIEMKKGAEFFMKLFGAMIPKVAVENPIPHKYAKYYIGQYAQLIQPWQFGEKQCKAVCLWLKGLSPLKPTNVVGPPPKNISQEEKRKWHKVHYTAPSATRWKERSRFFEGIAAAMAEQWS